MRTPTGTPLPPASAEPEQSSRWWQVTRSICTIGRETSIDGRLRQTAVAAAAAARARYAVVVVRDQTTERAHHSASDQVGVAAARRLLAAYRHPRSLDPDRPEDRRPAGLAVPISTDAGPYGVLHVLAPRDRDQFDAEDRALVACLAEAAGVGVDRAAAHEEAERRGDWLVASTEITQQLLSPATSPGAVADDICGHVLRLTAARTVTVELEDPDDLTRLEVRVAAGAGAAELRQQTVAVAGSVAEPALRHGEPQLDSAPALATTHTEATRTPVGAVLVVPFVSAHGLPGVVVVSRGRDQPSFTRADLRMVEDFARQVSLALELAEARRHQERLLVQAERDRIAERLQDDVVQRLFSIGLRLEAVHATAAGPTTRTGLRALVDDLDLAVRQIRRSVHPDDQHPGGQLAGDAASGRRPGRGPGRHSS